MSYWPSLFSWATWLGIGALTGVAAFFVGLISFASWLIAYVFSSMGIVNLAKARGYANPTHAWIPIYRYFILGKLIPGDEVSIFGSFDLRPVSLLFVVFNVATAFLRGVPVLNVILFIVFAIFLYFVFFKLYEKTLGSAMVIAILIAAVPFIGLFISSWVSNLLSLVMPITFYLAGKKEIEFAGRPPLL